MIRCAAQTDVGRKRPHNEDSLLTAVADGVFVVADGVGGRAAGEIASALAVDTFRRCGPRLRAAVDAYARQPDWQNRNGVLEVLEQTCQQASRAVYDESERQNKRGMTTTLVTALVGGGAVFL